MYDLIIIGGGPAAVAAGVYAARKKLKTLVIAEAFGGQSLISDSIGNWIGTKNLSGFDLATNLEEHLRAQPDIEIKMERAIGIRDIAASDPKRPHDFEVELASGERAQAKAVILATGSHRRRLGVPGEDTLDGKGVMFCATCDAPLFGGKRVAVVGGGNSGLEAVVDLFPYATEIYLLHRGPELKGDQVTQDEVRKNPKAKILLNTAIQEFIGDQFLEALRYQDKATGEVYELAVEGAFIEIGSVPNSDLVKELVDLNPAGEIIVDHRTGATSKPGMFAAGDVTDDLYKQNNISAGDGVVAALSAYAYVLGLKMHGTSAGGRV